MDDPSSTGTWKIPKPGRGMYIPFATVSVIASLLTGGWALLERWRSYAEAEKKAAVEHDRKERALLQRIESIERWKCILGWDPGGVKGTSTRNPDRTCAAQPSHEPEP